MTPNFIYLDVDEIIENDSQELPEPENNNQSKKKSDDNSIKNLIIKNEKNVKDLSVNNSNSSQTTSIEKLVIEKIK